MPCLQLHLHFSALWNRHTRAEHIIRTLLWTTSSLQQDRFFNTFSVWKYRVSLAALATTLQTCIHSWLAYSHTQWEHLRSESWHIYSIGMICSLGALIPLLAINRTQKTPLGLKYKFTNSWWYVIYISHYNWITFLSIAFCHCYHPLTIPTEMWKFSRFFDPLFLRKMHYLKIYLHLPFFAII